MNPTLALSQAARRAFDEAEGRPLFRAGWERAVFIHYEVEAAALQPQVPFPLETRGGRAYVSLVAFTLAGLRFAAGGPPLCTHPFLNVRTYLPGNGIYFLAEWLPHPLCVLLGPRLYGLPYQRGRLQYEHGDRLDSIHGQVRAPEGVLKYRARGIPARAPVPCLPGSLDEFLLERYTAFTRRGPTERLFRVWHAPWPQVSLEVSIEDESLVASTGPWFRQARLIGGHYSPGLAEVWMGRPRRRVLAC